MTAEPDDVFPLPSVLAELRRARAGGASFDAAWEGAVEAALTGLGRWVALPWLRALEETREAWEAAYERASDPAASPLADLGAAVRDTDFDGWLPGVGAPA